MGEEKKQEKEAISLKSVTFTGWLLRLQLHDFANVHLQFHCCGKDFNYPQKISHIKQILFKYEN
ncbi:MAG: hypothetical protein HFG69_11810 [Hungatella sp.]|nr:hypothetical protein [Hungatella sp.]